MASVALIEQIERARRGTRTETKRTSYKELDKDLVDRVRERNIHLKVDEVAEALGEKSDYGYFGLWGGWTDLGKKCVFERDGLKITKTWRSTVASYNDNSIYCHSYSKHDDRWLSKQRGWLPAIYTFVPGSWEEILGSVYEEIQR